MESGEKHLNVSQTHRPRLLIIAGNDPSGGAGLTADTQTATALGWHPLPVVTAITAQNTRDVVSVTPMTAQSVRDQLDVLLRDVSPDAVKVGLLPDADVAAVTGAALAALRGIPVVVDPVLKAGGGGRLAADPVATALVTSVLPHATVTTPNRFELQRLTPAMQGTPIQRAGMLATQCGCHVLVTGADEAGDRGEAEVINTAVLRDGSTYDWRWPRLPERYHGSGCTMAAALACYLGGAVGAGDTLEAMRRAQRYTEAALHLAFRPGRGQHVPGRMLEYRT